jgi:TRAP transporter T-component
MRVEHPSKSGNWTQAAAAVIAVCVASCAGEQSAHKPDPRPGQSSSAAADATSANAARATQSADAKPRLCGVGNSESEVSEEILSRSGRGLLWLVVPDRAQTDEDEDEVEVIRRGAEEVRGARALADCLLNHHDPGFAATQTQAHDALVAWVDAHLGPEHAQTLLAAGAAYLASMLVAESWIDAALDVPAARLFLERATAAAPQLSDGLGPLILGAYECFIPKPVGGQPAAGLRRLEEAASHGGRFRLAMKVAAAELCAFGLQDRALFFRLLDEVEASRDASSTFDLLAKERARTLRTEVDELFPDQS